MLDKRMKSNINRKSLAQRDLTLLVTIAKVMLHVQVAITILEATKQISKYQNLAQFQAYLIFIFMEEKLSRQEQEQRENKREKKWVMYALYLLQITSHLR